MRRFAEYSEAARRAALILFRSNESLRCKSKHSDSFATWPSQLA
jgi:hypothetical protein